MSKKQAAEKAEKPVPSTEQVAEWILRDIQMCMSFLNMVRADPKVLHMIAETIHARHLEEIEKAKLQPELELNGSAK